MEMNITRRQFVQGLAAAGAVAGLNRAGLSQAASRPTDEIDLALIGAGAQGRSLMILCTKIPGVRCRAVCDIWPYHQKYASAILGKLGQPVNVYEDYRDLLAKEKGLTGAIVATPDFVHAEQTIACLKAGLYVYVEKAMGHPLEQVVTVVEAARQTGRLVQVGTHRRSLPWYCWTHKLVAEDKVLGRVPCLCCSAGMQVAQFRLRGSLPAEQARATWPTWNRSIERLSSGMRSPARRGLVDHPGKWAWSSWRAWEERTDQPLRVDFDSLPPRSTI